MILIYIDCSDETPGGDKCTWNCAQWSGVGGNGKNYCDDDWSNHRHCVPNITTSGRIKDWCKASCGNCKGKLNNCRAASVLDNLQNFSSFWLYFIAF